MNKCLEPSMQCPNKAIRAHSIQNARVLDLLCEDNHVIQLKLSFTADPPPKPEYKYIGRNLATTFAGLCADHDKEIFKDIDTRGIDPDNQRQLFLLAYRAVLRELHATMDGAMLIQGTYQKRVALGLDPKNVPSDAGMQAVSHMIKSWRTFRYKCKFDAIEASGLYDEIVHFTRVIDNTMPTVAASVLFGIEKYAGNEDIVGVVLNIMPMDFARTLVVLSWFPEHDPEIRSEYPDLYSATGPYFNYCISKMLLARGENFVINPAYFGEWPEEKKNQIKEYFLATMFHGTDLESEYLYLF